MKKALAILLSAIMVLGLMAGCGAQPAASASAAPAPVAPTPAAPAPKEKVTIRMAYWNNEDTVKTLLAYWAETVPEVQIDYQFIENAQFDSIIDTQLAAGEAPDLIIESPASARKHAKLGYIEDISQYYDRYVPAGTGAYSYDGKLYALPGISWFNGVFYNVDLFKANNIAVPTNFDQWMEACSKFDALGITPIASGCKDYQTMMTTAYAVVTAEYLGKEAGRNFGAQLADGKATFAKTWTPFMQTWEEMITKGKVYNKDMLGISIDQSIDMFATGKAAMYCSGPWDTEVIKGKNPNINMDMFPYYGKDGSDGGWLIGGPGCGFAVNAKSKHKDLIYKLYDALSTPEGQKAFWQDNQGGSSYLSAGVELPMPKEFTSAMSALKSGNVFCPWNEWGDAAAVYQDFGKELQGYLSGTTTLEQTLENTDKKVAELLAK